MRKYLPSHSLSSVESFRYGAILLIVSLLVACNNNGSSNSGNPSQNLLAAQNPDSMMVRMSRQTQQLEGIRVAKADTQSFRNSLQAYGMVLSPSKLIALRNQQVKLQQRIRKEKAQLEVSSQEYQRQDTLYQHNGTSRKVWQQARAQWIADRADLETDRQSISALMDSSKAHWGPVIPNWVQKNTAKIQQLINRDAWLIEVTPVNTPENSFQPANVVTIGNRQQPFTARYISVSPRMNPRIQKRSYYYLVEHPPVPLAAGQNLNVTLPIGPSRRAMIIPDSAIIWTQGKPWFYAQQGPEEFRRRSLSSARFQHGQWYLPEAIVPGHNIPGVVVSGASILLAKEQRAGQPTISKKKEGDND